MAKDAPGRLGNGSPDEATRDEIRRVYALQQPKTTMEELAVRFGLSKNRVWKIVNEGRALVTPEVVAAFRSKVDENGPIHPVLKTRCHDWTGTRQSNGYGTFGFGLKTEQAHRVAWFLEYGRWPEPCGLHKCDRRCCVRIDHLFEGTIADNTRDMVEKGRARGGTLTGEQHGSAKVTDAVAEEIKRLAALGTRTHREIAFKFKISKAQVWNIVNGRSRK